MSLRTLLGVWAHPDDEAYTSAGLMAYFRRRGDRVVVIEVGDPLAELGQRPRSLRLDAQFRRQHRSTRSSTWLA
jgi:LmbE family N-acetylglucosaminyl deacetylase